MDSTPITIFDLTDELAWKTHAIEAMNKANLLVNTPLKNQPNDLEMLSMLGIQRWSTFEKLSIMFTVHQAPRYIFLYITLKDQEGMWTNKTLNIRQFHPSTPLDWILKALAEEMMEQEKRMSSTALMLPHKKSA